MKIVNYSYQGKKFVKVCFSDKELSDFLISNASKIDVLSISEDGKEVYNSED